MSIRVGEAGNNGLDIPNQLVTIETLRAEDAVLTRPFILKQGMGGEIYRCLDVNQAESQHALQEITVNDSWQQALAIGHTKARYGG
jgi:hypothetical protein